MTQQPFTIVLTEIEAFGGAERSIIALSRWLHGRSFPHRLLVYRDHIGLADYAAHPIDIVELNPSMNPFGRIGALKRYFRSMPTDAPPPLASGLQSALHMSLAGIRGFHTLMHDTPSLLSGEAHTPNIKRRARRMVEDRILTRGLNSGGTTIVTSTYLSDEAVKLWHPPVSIARMGGIQAGRFRPHAVDKQFRMLTVSRIEANKRIDWVLHALAELESGTTPLHQRADWTFDIAGEGSQIEPLRRLSEKLSLATRVRFHGFVSDEQLADLYNIADLFLMPARQGYGIPAIEALTRGIPVLLHRDSGVSDLLLDTPWATVMDGGESGMTAALEMSIEMLLRGHHLEAPLPHLPTEDEWADKIARICGWFGVQNG